jgi:hypothetical protein
MMAPGKLETNRAEYNEYKFTLPFLTCLRLGDAWARYGMVSLVWALCHHILSLT